jgi:hypothetical protein
MVNNMFICICFDVKVMSKIRMCRYECGTGDFDEKQNKYIELSGTLHTRERCQSLKSQTKVGTGTKPLSLEELDARLKRVEAMFNVNGGLQK